MIERENTNELQGQYTLDDLLPGDGGNQDAQPMEGYDAEGNLLNEDYPPIAERPGTGEATSSDPPQAAAHLPLKGKAFGETGQDTPADPFDLDALLASGIAGLSPSDPQESPGETRDAKRGGALMGVI